MLFSLELFFCGITCDIPGNRRLWIDLNSTCAILHEPMVPPRDETRSGVVLKWKAHLHLFGSLWGFLWSENFEGGISISFEDFFPQLGLPGGLLLNFLKEPVISPGPEGSPGSGGRFPQLKKPSSPASGPEVAKLRCLS